MENSIAERIWTFSQSSRSFLRVFDPSSIINLYSFRISSKSDLFSLFQERLRASGQRKIFINTAYKRKADKIYPVNLDKSDNSVPGERED